MPDIRTKIYFRADGSGIIGLGHIARCIAMAEMLSMEAYHIVFLVRHAPEFLKEWALLNSADVIELGLSTGYLQEAESISSHILSGKEIVVLDGYSFDTQYQRILKEKETRLISIDDIHQHLFISDVVINHAGGMGKELYNIGSFTEMKLGPDYALLRKVFLEPGKELFPGPPIENGLFICMGGADPQNYTQKVLRKLEKDTRVNFVHVVIGEAFQHRASLSAYLAEAKHPRLFVHESVSPAEMSRLMKECAVGITSASTVAYEYLSAGGKLFVIQTADNQDLIYRFLTKEGFALTFEKWDSFPHAGTGKIPVEPVKGCIDLLSGVRIRRIVEDLARELTIGVRPAREEDIYAVYEWANDPGVRANSYNQENIPWESHEKWFYGKIAQDAGHYYIAECNGIRLGQVRLDQLEDDLFVINYLVGNEFRGKGWGKIMLSASMKYLVAALGKPVTLEGHVKAENIASQQIFRRLGFEQQESLRFPGSFKFSKRYEQF